MPERVRGIEYVESAAETLGIGRAEQQIADE